jgi:hypothetical protein
MSITGLTPRKLARDFSTQDRTNPFYRRGKDTYCSAIRIGHNG